MAVTSKKPDKPGYMTTEFMATASFVVYELLVKHGLSSENATDVVNQGESLVKSILSGDKDTITTVVVGAVIFGYGWLRTRIKRTKIIAEAKK